MKAVILAAGEGRRMRPLTLSEPKPMIRVGGKPLLAWIIEALPAEITELVLVVGYKSEQVRGYFGESYAGRPIRYVTQAEPKGTGHGLSLCRELIAPGERFLFLTGDDLHSAAAIKKLLSNPCGVLVHEHAEPQRFGVVETDAGSRVVGFEETPEKPKSNLVSLAVFVLDDRIFSYPMTLSKRGEYWSTDQIRQMMADVPFIAVRSDFWVPISSPADLVKAERALALPREPMSLPVLVLAGGKGTRLPESEQNKPKALVEIAGKPILQHQLERLRAEGFSDIRLSLGYKAEHVVEWLTTSGNSDVRYVIEEKPLGTGGGLKLAAADITTPFIALNVDDLADVDYRLLIRHGLNGSFSVVVGMRTEEAREFGTIVADEYKKIVGFEEKNPKGGAGVVSIGHYYLQPEIFKGTPEAFSIERDIFPKLAESGRLVLDTHTGYWLTTNNEQQLLRAREFFNQ